MNSLEYMFREVVRRGEKEREEKHGVTQKDLKSLFEIFTTMTDQDEACAIYAIEDIWQKVGDLKKERNNWHFINSKCWAVRRAKD